MSLIRLDFLSKYLEMHTAVNITLPMPADADAPMEDIPSVILLHDMGDDDSAWMRNVPVERYAMEKGAAVIMPDGMLSCYENMRYGGAFRSYIGKELMDILCAYLPLSRRREKRFIAGCGMGGRGALKFALEHPENYAAAGVFSASHIEAEARNENEKTALFRAYGDDAGACRRFIEEKTAETAANGPAICIYHAACDAGADENLRATRALFENAGGKIDYRFESLSGKDNWASRERMFARFMDMIDIAAPEVPVK